MKKNYIKTIIAITSVIIVTQAGQVVFAKQNNDISIAKLSTNDDTLNYSASLDNKGKMKISEKKGTEFNLPVEITSMPKEHQAKSMEIVINIPTHFDIKNIKTVTSEIQVENVDYNLDSNGILRIALTNTSKNPITESWKINSRKILDITLSVKNDIQPNTKYDIKLQDLILRCSNDWDKSYETTNNGITTIEITNTISKDIEARELYVSNGKNVLPEGKKVVEVKLSEEYKDNEIIFDYMESNYSCTEDGYYSTELTKKNNKDTYLLLVDSTIPLDRFENKKNYMFFPLFDDLARSKELKLGDADKNGIDAQDATKCISAWLRKSTLMDVEMLSLNVNGDGEITTRDAVDIVDSYISGKEFKILSM